VVDEENGRGVPLVELRTVNNIRYFTDSNGIVAFDEPGLMNHKVFFTVISHGYQFEADGFGFRGKALDVAAGGSARLTIKRVNIARRLYRVTGAGIYRDSVLTGDLIPIGQPLLNGEVVGQDSVVNAVYQGKVHWFWGDTNRPDYPLGDFHVPGATSPLPGKGVLDPAVGIDLTYLVDDKGFARPTAAMAGEGPTWIFGLVVIIDEQKHERLFATYSKVRKQLEVYERGLVEFRPEKQRFEKVATFPAASAYPGEYPGGHTFLHRDQGIDYVYYCNPYPLVRVPADPARLARIDAYEAYTCLKPGTRWSERQLDHGSDGRLRYGWKTRTQLLPQEEQNRLIAGRVIAPDQALLHLRDIDSGKGVIAQGGSVYWNDYRGRWVMIAVESHGESSYLGEIWFAEADSPVGPWVYARKIVTHKEYSFYNPKQHPMFDKDGGREILFEGTYVTTFSGNPDPTPRYDYNQIMYQLDLSEGRLALPVAIYRRPARQGSGVHFGPITREPDRAPAPGAPAVFFAPERPGIAALPVYESSEPRDGAASVLQVGRAGSEGTTPETRPLFYVLPPDSPDFARTTVPLYEYQPESGRERYYSVAAPSAVARSDKKARAIGRVWRNPAVR
jgi:hypothetical protein